MEKTLLVVLVVIGAILFFGLLPLAPGSKVETPKIEQQELIESGQFVLKQLGVPVVEEEYTLLFSSEEGYMLLSQAVLSAGGQEITLAQQYQFDRGFLPFLYHLAAETPSGSQLISAQMGITGLHMETRIGQAHQSADIPDARKTFILDNNLLSHYVVLLMAAQAGVVQGDFTAAIPQALLTIPSSLKGPQAVEFTSGEERYQGALYDLRMGDIAIELVVYNGRLAGVFIPAQSVEGYNPNLFKDGISLEQRQPEAQALPAGVREREITFKSKKVTLSGTLTLPEGAREPVPAVLFVHGSGPLDRDENAPGMVINVFRELAYALAQVGVGSLRYDKRGVGKSEGSFIDASRDDLLADVDAALTTLKATREIDADRCFLLGHSEGGYLVPALAATDSTIAGLILLAAPARSLAEITRWQVETLARMKGLSEDEIAEALAQEDEFISFVKSSSGQWSDYSFDDLKEAMPWLTEEKAEEMRHSFSLAWLREHYLQNPLENIRRITCPVLLLYGEKDLQIPETEGKLFSEGLKQAGNTDATVQIFPDLNHLLRYHPEAPNLVFRHVDQPVDPRVVDAVTGWVLEHSVR